MILLVLLACASAFGQQPASDPDLFLKQGLEAYNRGAFATAIKQWTEGLRAAETQKDHLFAGTFHGNLALAYAGRGEHDRAIGHLETAVRIARRLDDRRGLANRLNNLGGFYMSGSKPREAAQALEEALRLARDLEDRDLAATIRNNLGQARLLLGENLTAASLLREALAQAAERKDTRAEAESASHLGAAHAATGNYAQALSHFRLSLSLTAGAAPGAAIARLRIRTYQRMAELTRDLGDLAAALTFYRAAAAEAGEAVLAAPRDENTRLAAEIAALDDGKPATRERLRVEGLIRMRDRLRAHGLDQLAKQVEERINEAPSPPPPGPK